MACAEQASNQQYTKDTELATRFNIQRAPAGSKAFDPAAAAHRAANALVQDVTMKIPLTRRQELEKAVLVRILVLACDEA